jgi:hypothetical protein
VYREARRGSRASLRQPSPRRGAHVRALSVRLVSLRLTRVPSGVVSRADRARAHRPKLFFALSRAAPPTCVRRFRSSEKGRTCRRFVCHVSGRRCSCFSGKQSPDSPSPNRRLRMLSFPGARQESFFLRDQFSAGFFAHTSYAHGVWKFRPSALGISFWTRQRSRTQRRAGSPVIRHTLVIHPTLIGAGDTARGRGL